jgi:dTDP-4-dehydrorhamnose reductase
MNTKIEEKTPTIWVTGCHGMLGGELVRQFEKTGLLYTGTGHEIDITDQTMLDAYAEKLADEGRGPEWIVNCSAYTAVDRAEDEKEQARTVNADGIRNLARTAKKIGSRFIHISTDYVFAGTAGMPYTEDMPAGPQSVYGSTKLDGERAALCILPQAAWILRASWLYGFDGKNFVYTMIRLMNSRPFISVVNDQHGTPTCCTTLASAIVSVIRSAVHPATAIPPGIYHCTDRGETTWFDFARAIYETGTVHGVITHGCSIQPCTTAEYPVRAKRPAYSVLNTAKLSLALKRAAMPALPASWKKTLELFMNDERVKNSPFIR